MIETIINAESSMLLFIQQAIRNPLLTPFFLFVTRLGDNSIIWIAITFVMLIPKKTRKIGYMMVISLLGAQIINNMLVKNLVGRARPYDMIEGLSPLVAKMRNYSFPSGHTASSFAAAGILFRKLPKRFGIPALVLAALIGFSRLYIGVHYPTDVLFGIISGIGISYIAEFAVDFRYSSSLSAPD